MSIRVQADNLPVKNGVLHAQPCQVVAQGFEAFVRITIAGNQAALPVFDVGQRAETVVLQLKQPVRIVEGGQ